VGFLQAELGIGEAARKLGRGLGRAGIPVSAMRKPWRSYRWRAGFDVVVESAMRAWPSLRASASALAFSAAVPTIPKRVTTPLRVSTFTSSAGTSAAIRRIAALLGKGRSVR